MDGLTFVRRLRERAREEGGRIPVVAITAYHEQYSVAEAMDIGFVAYLKKPLDLEELCRRCPDGRPSDCLTPATCLPVMTGVAPVVDMTGML